MKRLLLLTYTLMLTAAFSTVNAQTEKMRTATELTKPVVLEATNVTRNGFTANWEPVENAEAYCVFVYTEHEASKDETFTVLYEDFNRIDFGNIGDPVWSDELYENLDIYTSLPNWTVYGYTTYVQGMVGGIVYSPYIDLRNAGGKYTVSVSVYGESGDEIFIESNGSSEEVKSFVLDHTGISFATFTFTNGVQDTFFHLHNTTGNEFYVDEVAVTQDLKAGDKAYVYVDLNDAVPATQTSCNFKKLKYAPDADIVYYDLYAVVREYNDPAHPDRYEQVYSPFSDKMGVVLNPEATDIENNIADDTDFSISNGILNLNKAADIRVFDISGRTVITRHYEAGTHDMQLTEGIYVLSINNKTYKINI